MDRNKIRIAPIDSIRVALRKESVDRNTNPGSTTLTFPGSLSARRAWIEIPSGCWRDARRAVALRKESVDRNQGRDRFGLGFCVALRKESVDRNDNGNAVALSDLGRSPQGERG